MNIKISLSRVNNNSIDDKRREDYLPILQVKYIKVVGFSCMYIYYLIAPVFLIYCNLIVCTIHFLCITDADYSLALPCLQSVTVMMLLIFTFFHKKNYIKSNTALKLVDESWNTLLWVDTKSWTSWDEFFELSTNKFLLTFSCFMKTTTNKKTLTNKLIMRDEVFHHVPWVVLTKQTCIKLLCMLERLKKRSDFLSKSQSSSFTISLASTLLSPTPFSYYYHHHLWYYHVVLYKYPNSFHIIMIISFIIGAKTKCHIR